MLRNLTKLLVGKQQLSCAAQPGWRSIQTESKGMLGGSGAMGMGSATTVVEQAAGARIKKIKDQLEAQGALAPEEPSTTGKVVGYVWNTVFLGLLGAAGTAGYYTYAYDAKDLSKQLAEVRSRQDDSLPNKLWCEAMGKYLEWRKYTEQKVKDFTDPTYHKLLPDLPPDLRGKIKTLVLDLDEVLINKEWTRQKGWVIYKRPGVQDFILEMGQYFEVVVFTDEPNTYADPIINRLDVHKVIPYRLYRPETQYHNGKHVRDLSKLNRDLSQVLFISANPEAYEFQPENTIKLKAWDNSPKDTTLLDMIPFLQMIAMRGIKDTRDVVKSYDGVDDIPKAFRARMTAAQVQQKQPKRSILSLR